MAKVEHAAEATTTTTARVSLPSQILRAGSPLELLSPKLARRYACAKGRHRNTAAARRAKGQTVSAIGARTRVVNS
eukprot:4309306-Pleurochrysis_carterae.AAC.1